jgi:monoterpene epsilon-lactone hydrolase
VSAALLGQAVRIGIKPILGPWVPPRAQRIAIDVLCASLPRARVSHHRDTVGGVPVLTHTPRDARPGATLVYLHGGGYVTGSPSGYAAVTSHLARAANSRVVSVDYRLAPEHPFPAAPEDALAVYAALLHPRQDPAQLTVAGDSAGGGLALATVLGAREHGLALPGRLIMFSPWLDLRPRDPGADADRLLGAAGLERWARLYAGDHPREDPHCSPGLTIDLSGLPPTLIQYDTDELLASDATGFIARAQSAGVAVESQPFHGLWHDFQLFTQLPQARRALRLAGDFAAS